MRALFALLIAASPLWLSGCDMLGIETAPVLAARHEAEGKAVGGACRHAGRAIEDCYALNRRAEKSAVFQGWREMDDYMRENKLEAVAPTLRPDGTPLAGGSDADTPDTDAEADGDDTDVSEAPARKTARNGH